MTTNIQSVIEKQRTEYESLGKPLLQSLAELHGLTIREFAEVFIISKAHAEDLLKHRVLPSLGLAFRIARYLGCTVEELFGWRVDDTGDRRPLLIEIPGKGVVRLSVNNPDHRALPLVREAAERLKGGEL